MTRPAILVQSKALWPRLSAHDFGEADLYGPEVIDGGLPATLAERIEIIISGGDALDNALIEALPRLRLVACFSTGYAGIDLGHLRARGIPLTTAAGVNAHDVADHAVALLLAWWHGIPAADRHLRQGSWRGGVPARRSLRGRKSGIVGLGRIGREIATRLTAHEMDVAWWGPREKPGSGFPRADNLVELAKWSDALIVASRATPENRHQIDAAVLDALGPEGLLINVSRGFLVDEDALLAALRNGTIAGAALDVFEEEPTDPGLWRNLENVVLTPHLAGFTREAGIDMLAQLIENVRRQLAGEPLLSPVDDRL